VPARLVAQQPPHAIDRFVSRRPLAPLADGCAGDLRRAVEDDPERLAGRVVVGGYDLDARSVAPQRTIVNGPRSCKA
jgi:hypothetical protein